MLEWFCELFTCAVLFRPRALCLRCSADVTPDCSRRRQPSAASDATRLQRTHSNAVTPVPHARKDQPNAAQRLQPETVRTSTHWTAEPKLHAGLHELPLMSFDGKCRVRVVGTCLCITTWTPTHFGTSRTCGTSIVCFTLQTTVLLQPGCIHSLERAMHGAGSTYSAPARGASTTGAVTRRGAGTGTARPRVQVAWWSLVQRLTSPPSWHVKEYWKQLHFCQLILTLLSHGIRPRANVNPPVYELYRRHSDSLLKPLLRVTTAIINVVDARCSTYM